METVDLEEAKTVFAALFDTCVQYLRPEVIISHNSWFSEHQDKFLEADSTGDSEIEALFRWILEDDGDMAILQFVKTLRELTSDSGDVDSIVNYGKDDEKHWIKYFVNLLDGSLIKELSLSDVHTVLDVMLDKKMITKQLHKKAKEAEHPHACCQVLFQGILKIRGKPNWPFVFFEAISQIKPDLVQPKAENAEQQAVSKQACSRIKIGSIMAGMNTFCDDILRRLDELSIFSDGFVNESLEPVVCLSEQESKSGAIQAWVASTNVDPSSIAFYDTWNTLHAFADTNTDIGSKPKETPTILLREYQKELAEAALKGINTIICAPTGCGKTLVAVHVILTHLQKPTARKVVFFARTVPLVMQQYQVLQTFLPPQFKVASLTGEDRNSLQLNNVLPDVDVLAMTPRILENHLIRNGQEQLDLFSLLVFDECHHTRKDEPYNMLMHYYLKRKQKIHSAQSRGEQINDTLPQIMGLTASIGVDNATKDDEAKENVLKLCSNLDVEYISYVEKHIEELKEKVHLSKEELVTIYERIEDVAVSRILDKMKALEGCMVDLANKLKHEELKTLLKNIPTFRKTIFYGNWVVKVKNIARSLPRSALGELNNYKRLLIILADYLGTYNLALELHDLVLLKHVMEYLQRCFDQFQENKDCTQEEKAYFESFSDLQERIKDQLDFENPNLTLLKSCLMKYIVAKGDASRGIIFVRTRALVRAVTSWLNSCGNPNIESLRAAPFTGTSASLALGGMTAAQQREVIQLFRMGQVRLLVATSVAEEGIDIPECNLVVKYNYTGNEITTVQTRGRSRKKGGMCVILAMSKMIEKERMNQRKAEMMDRAVQQIRLMNPSEVHMKIEAYQQQTLKDIQNIEHIKKQLNMSKRKENFKMVCHGCGDLVIDSSDIRLICQTHHVVVNWDIMKKTHTVAEKEHTLFDDIRLIGPVKCRGKIQGGRHCNNKLGSLMIFSNIPFVVLGIKNFGFELWANPRTLSNYRNWKDVPYVIDEIAPTDIERYLPDVTASGGDHHDNRRQLFLGEGHDVVHNYSSLPTVLQHSERKGRRDEQTTKVVTSPAKMKGKMSFADISHPYSIAAHASLSFQALGLAERSRLSSATGGPEGIRNDSGALFSGWTHMESKLSSTGQPVLQEMLPSPQFSEESSEADSMSTLHSDSYQTTVTDPGEDNFDKKGVNSISMETNRDIEDMDTMTSSPVIANTEQMQAKNGASYMDAGSEIEHLAEVGDSFFLS